MKEKYPIKFKEHLQLKDVGINVSKVGFSNLTMQSDRFVCVTDSDGGKKSLVIIDLDDSANPIRMPSRADSAIMNPTDKIIALKVSLSGVIQVFDIERRQRMKNHTMNEDVVFWKWITSDMIALMTSKSVYHWNMKDDAPPLKIFDCSPRLSTCQPIDYRTDSQQKHSLIIGTLTKGERATSGTIQRYSVQSGTTKILEGHVATFAEIVLDGNKDSSILLCSASSTQKGNVLSVAQVSHAVSMDQPFRKRSVVVTFSIPNDTPIDMQESKVHKVLLVLSKHGFFHLYHLETLDCMFKNRMSTDIIFATAPCAAVDGIISVNSKGQVLSALVDDQYIVSFLNKKLVTSKHVCDTGVLNENEDTAKGKSRFFVTAHNHRNVNDRFKLKAAIQEMSMLASSGTGPLDNKVLHMLALDGCKLEQKLDLKPLKQQFSTSPAGWILPQAITNENEKPNALDKPSLENWLMHSTNTDSKEKRHFWKFQDGVITLYLSKGGSLIFKQIPLTSIAGVRLLKNGTRLSLKFADSKIVMYVRSSDKERSHNILDQWCHGLNQALAFKETSSPVTGEPAVMPAPSIDKHPGIFNGVQFVFHFHQHTMEAKKTLRQLVTVNGGQISYTLNKNTTFFVCDSDRETYRHQKAMKIGVSVVPEKFLSDCVAAGKLLPAPQSEAVLRGIKDKFSRGAISIRDKVDKSRQKKKVEFSLEKLKRYKLDGAECPDFPETFQVAKFSFLTNQKGEWAVCVEAHVSSESDELYRVMVSQKHTGDTKVRRSMYFVKNLYDLTRCYESVIKSIESNDTRRCTDIMEIAAEGVATEKLQNLLEEMKISKGSLHKKVQHLVATLWEDSLGALAEYDVISQGITPHDVRNGLVALLKIEKAIKEGKDCSKLSAEFYTYVRRKSTEVIDSVRKVAKEREICQILRDVVCVKENLLNTVDVRSFMLQYSALNCVIKYVSPSENEYKLVKDLLPAQNEVRHEIVNIYQVSRTAEDIEFRSGLKNKKLLFHSSATSNFVSILSKGLVMPSKASAELGIPRTDEGKLGHGIYFSDSFKISSKYTNVSESRGTRLMLVSEIALGRVYDTEKSMPELQSSPQGFDCVCGKNLNGEMIGNEFVIYKENQQRMKYLIEFTLPGENPRTDHQLKELPIFKPTIDVPSIESTESFQPSVKSVTYGLVSSTKNAVNLEEFHVRGKIVDLVAEVTVFQVYRNNLKSQIEGKYVFPLEENAAVCGFEAFINDKHVVGEVKEKQQARKEYKKAVSQGHGAYLMDEEEPNVFTLSLGNIPARARVIIKIKYVCELETVNDPDSCVLFTLPENLSEHKQESTLIDGSPTQSNTNSLKVAQNAKKTSLMLSIDMPYDILDISSPTHGISYKKTLSKACVKLKSSVSLLENKLQLLVKVAEIHVPRIWVEHIEDKTGADKIKDGHSNEVAMVTFFPEFDFDACHDYCCTILVDMSSSMAGKSGNHAKHIANNLIELLPETTKFNVVVFGSYFKEVFVTFENASDDMKLKAKDMINSCKPNLGGSDLVHILAAMSLLGDSSDQTSLQNVFLISDGHLSEETRTLRLASKISDVSSSQTRFFTFAVGESPNAHFLRSMCDLTGGKYEQFLPSVKHTWVGQIKNQLRYAQQPVLTNVHIDWCNYETDTHKSFVNVPEKPKCVFSGSRLTAFSFVPNCSKATLHACIMGNEISTVVTVSSQSKVTGRTLHYLASKAIFKEHEAANLADSSLVDEIYRDERKSYIISLSVRNSVVCKFTSFIAVEKREAGEDMSVVTGPTVEELLKSCFVDEISEVPWQELDSELSPRDKIKDILKRVEQMETSSILRARELVRSALSTCENEKDPLAKVLVSASCLRLGVSTEELNADAILSETLLDRGLPNFEVLHEMSKCESPSYSKAVEDLVSHSWSAENRMRLQSVPLLYRPAVVAAFLISCEKPKPHSGEGDFWNYVGGIDMEKEYRNVVKEVTAREWQSELLRKWILNKTRLRKSSRAVTRTCALSVENESEKSMANGGLDRGIQSYSMALPQQPQFTASAKSREMSNKTVEYANSMTVSLIGDVAFPHAGLRSLEGRGLKFSGGSDVKFDSEKSIASLKHMSATGTVTGGGELQSPTPIRRMKKKLSFKPLSAHPPRLQQPSQQPAAGGQASENLPPTQPSATPPTLFGFSRRSAQHSDFIRRSSATMERVAAAAPITKSATVIPGTNLVPSGNSAPYKSDLGSSLNQDKESDDGVETARMDPLEQLLMASAPNTLKATDCLVLENLSDTPCINPYAHRAASASNRLASSIRDKQSDDDMGYSFSHSITPEHPMPPKPRNFCLEKSKVGMKQMFTKEAVTGIGELHPLTPLRMTVPQMPRPLSARAPRLRQPSQQPASGGQTAENLPSTQPFASPSTLFGFSHQTAQHSDYKRRSSPIIVDNLERVAAAAPVRKSDIPGTNLVPSVNSAAYKSDWRASLIQGKESYDDGVGSAGFHSIEQEQPTPPWKMKKDIGSRSIPMAPPRFLSTESRGPPVSKDGQHGLKISGGSDVNSGLEKSMANVDYLSARGTVTGGGELRFRTALRKGFRPQLDHTPMLAQPSEQPAAEGQTPPDLPSTQPAQPFASLSTMSGFSRQSAQYTACMQQQPAPIPDEEDRGYGTSRYAAMQQRLNFIKSAPRARAAAAQAIAITETAGTNIVPPVSSATYKSDLRASSNQDKESDDGVGSALFDSLEQELPAPPMVLKAFKQDRVCSRQIPEPFSDSLYTRSRSLRLNADVNVEPTGSKAAPQATAAPASKSPVAAVAYRSHLRASLNQYKELDDFADYEYSCPIPLEHPTPPVARGYSAQTPIHGSSRSSESPAHQHSYLPSHSSSPPVKSRHHAQAQFCSNFSPEEEEQIFLEAAASLSRLGTKNRDSLFSATRSKSNLKLSANLAEETNNQLTSSEEESDDDTSSASSDPKAPERPSPPELFRCQASLENSGIDESIFQDDCYEYCIDSYDDCLASYDDCYEDCSAPVRSLALTRNTENVPGLSRRDVNSKEDFDELLVRIATELIELSGGSEKYMENLAEKAAEKIVIASGGKSLDPTSFNQAKKMLCQSALILLYEAFVRLGNKHFAILIERLKKERKLADAKVPMIYDRLELGSSWEAAARKVIVAIDLRHCDVYDDDIWV